MQEIEKYTKRNAVIMPETDFREYVRDCYGMTARLQINAARKYEVILNGQTLPAADLMKKLSRRLDIDVRKLTPQTAKDGTESVIVEYRYIGYSTIHSIVMMNSEGTMAAVARIAVLDNAEGRKIHSAEDLGKVISTTCMDYYAVTEDIEISEIQTPFRVSTVLEILPDYICREHGFHVIDIMDDQLCVYWDSDIASPLDFYEHKKAELEGIQYRNCLQPCAFCREGHCRWAYMFGEEPTFDEHEECECFTKMPERANKKMKQKAEPAPETPVRQEKTEAPAPEEKPPEKPPVQKPDPEPKPKQETPVPEAEDPAPVPEQKPEPQEIPADIEPPEPDPEGDPEENPDPKGEPDYDDDPDDNTNPPYEEDPDGGTSWHIPDMDGDGNGGGEGGAGEWY